MRSKVDQDACGQTRASHCAASFISAWSFGYTRPSFHAPDGPFLFNICHCPALVRIIGAAQKTHLLVIPDGDHRTRRRERLCPANRQMIRPNIGTQAIYPGAAC
jgi:hypothetical protein